MMNRARIGIGLLVLAALSHAAPGAAQPVYVLGVAGIDTTVESRYVVNDQERPRVDGTEATFGARAGVSLGPRWGVEVDVARSAVSRTSTEGSRGLLSTPSGGFGLSLSDFAIDTRERHHSVGTLVWLRHDVAARTALVLLGGLSFQRSDVEERYAFPGFDPFFGSGPEQIRAVSYGVGPTVAAEVRTWLGEHVVLAPGVRVSSALAGWCIRPAISAGWAF